jgi:hypothetical protein
MMGVTSNESKQRYNASKYTQVKVSINHEIAAAFKAYCVLAGVSIAGEISRFMCAKCDMPNSEITIAGNIKTRQKRRVAVKKIVRQLEAIMYAEMEYLRRIPENLRSSSVYETAEQTVSDLEEALLILNEAY